MTARTPVDLRAKVDELKSHVRDPLYRNAYALMLNTAITGALGALWWVVAARVYEADDVGYAGALVAAMQLLSAVTQLNLSSVLMRFIPRAGRASSYLLGISYAVSIGCAVVVTAIVLGVASLVSSDDYVLNMSLGLAVAFIGATAAYSIFNLQDAALIGLRRSIWVPIENAVFGVAKIATLFLFVGIFGALGIFASWAIPLAIIIFPVNHLVFRKLMKSHEESTLVDAQPIERKKVIRFIAGDYPGSLFIQASTTLLPLLVVSSLGETENGYFVIAQSIGVMLDLVIINLASSFTVEAAHDESKIAEYARRMLWHMARIVLPVVAIVLIFAPLILSIFGDEYHDNSATVLRLLALASIPRMFSSIYGAMARLEHKTYKIAVMTAVQASILVFGSLLLMPHMGLEGVGVAGLASQLATAAFIVPKLLRSLRPSNPTVEIVNR